MVEVEQILLVADANRINTPVYRETKYVAFTRFFGLNKDFIKAVRAGGEGSPFYETFS